MKFNISYVYADRPGEYNTSNFRMIMPGRALGKAGYHVNAVPIQLFQEQKEEAKNAIERSHIIVVERNFIGDVIREMAHWKVRGRVIISNWDDAYHVIEKTNISYPFWSDGTVTVNENGKDEVKKIFPHPYDQFQWGVKLSHAATLPSKYMMKYWENIIPTYFVPNYFETQHYIDIPKDTRDYITIGWGGSVSHLQSFKDSGVLQALKNIVKARNNVKVVICGDKRVYDQVEIPDDKKIFHNYVPYEKWGSLLAKKFDIGIAPLAGEYDKYRSWIKPIEFMLTKTPWLASDNVAYDEFKDTNYGKIVENNPDTWTKELLDTLDNLSQEKENISGLPFEFAKQQDVNLHAEEIANIYREIAKKHAKIDLYANEPTIVEE